MRTCLFFALTVACAGTTEEDTANDDATCQTGSAEALMACAEPARYEADVTFVAQPRQPGTAHWQAVQDLCADRFAEYGLQVERHDYGTGINVIGVKPGTNPDRVMLGAHYDSTTEGCAGADDNATGVAALLEVARVLSEASFDDTLVFACWDQEEQGLIGSTAFASRELDAEVPYEVVYAYDMIGFTDMAEGSQRYPTGFDQLFYEQVQEIEARGNRGDFIAVIADEYAHEQAGQLAAHANEIGLLEAVLEVAQSVKMTSYLRDLRRSDHAAWWAADVPAVFITDTSEFRNPNYHCYNGAGTDALDTLDHAFAAQVVRMTIGGMAEAASVR